MNTIVQDLQVIGETESTLFEVLQQGPTAMLVTFLNRGVNTANYRWQALIGSTWTDMAELGDPLNSTLSAGQVRQMAVTSAYPQVRCVGYASGGATLDFTISRYYNRASGAALPLIAL